MKNGQKYFKKFTVFYTTSSTIFQQYAWKKLRAKKKQKKQKEHQIFQPFMKTFYENFIEIAKVRNYAWRRNIWNLFRYTRISTKAFIKNVLQNVLKQCDNAERSFFILKKYPGRLRLMLPGWLEIRFWTKKKFSFSFFIPFFI